MMTLIASPAVMQWKHVASSVIICTSYVHSELQVYSLCKKTDFGGQQSEPLPAGSTYIQDSSGYAANTLVEPNEPAGYEFVFGPTNRANNTPGLTIPLFFYLSCILI